MKVIDLLNDMAKGKNNEDNKYQFSYTDYCTIREFFDRYIVDEANLNLEIIEDTPKEDKKIEKIGKDTIYNNSVVGNVFILQTKIDEIIDKINGDSDE